MTLGPTPWICLACPEHFNDVNLLSVTKNSLKSGQRCQYLLKFIRTERSRNSALIEPIKFSPGIHTPFLSEITKHKPQSASTPGRICPYFCTTKAREEIVYRQIDWPCCRVRKGLYRLNMHLIKTSIDTSKTPFLAIIERTLLSQVKVGILSDGSSLFHKKT